MVVGGDDCAFLLPLVQGQIEALRATAEDRQKDRADNQALHGAIVSPPHHKEQSLWRLQMYQEYTAGAIEDNRMDSMNDFQKENTPMKLTNRFGCSV